MVYAYTIDIEIKYNYIVQVCVCKGSMCNTYYWDTVTSVKPWCHGLEYSLERLGTVLAQQRVEDEGEIPAIKGIIAYTTEL